MRNKAKLGRTGASGGPGPLPRPSGLAPRAKPIVRNKPIRRGVGREPVLSLPKERPTHSLSLRAASTKSQSRETKPNLGRMGHLGDGASGEANCAKQTQFRALPGGMGPRRAKMRKTKPIPDRRDTPLFHCPIIPPSPSDANRAKRTQFPKEGQPAWGGKVRHDSSQKGHAEAG
jgi:hypothetical protein